MSIHDGTSPDETLADTPAASTPTDAEKLLLVGIPINLFAITLDEYRKKLANDDSYFFSQEAITFRMYMESGIYFPSVSDYDLRQSIALMVANEFIRQRDKLKVK